MRLTDPVVFALPGSDPIAFDLALDLEAELGLLEHRRFPDGESLVRIVTTTHDRDVVLVATQRHPDEQFLTLAFAADAARAQGARRVGLIAPYLAYLRQDRSFRRGEAVSARTYGRLLSELADWIVTVDPHLHRLASLGEICNATALVVDAAPALGRWVKEHIDRPLIVGPDHESGQWARVVADAAAAPLVLLEKERLSDTDVRVSLQGTLPDENRRPVLVDDIISSGSTILTAARVLRAAGLGDPACVAVHAVFADEAYAQLLAGGIHPVVTTDTIPHPSNGIGVVPLIAAAVRDYPGVFRNTPTPPRSLKQHLPGAFTEGCSVERALPAE